jgi:hypothetical protein
VSAALEWTCKPHGAYEDKSTSERDEFATRQAQTIISYQRKVEMRLRSPSQPGFRSVAAVSRPEGFSRQSALIQCIRIGRRCTSFGCQPKKTL